jgi:hypothetical protein
MTIHSLHLWMSVCLSSFLSQTHYLSLSHTRTQIYMHTHAFTHTHKCTHIYTHTNAHTYEHTQMSPHMNTVTQMHTLSNSNAGLVKTFLFNLSKLFSSSSLFYNDVVLMAKRDDTGVSNLWSSKNILITKFMFLCTIFIVFALPVSDIQCKLK